MLTLIATCLLAAAPASHHATWLPFPGQGNASVDYLAFDPAHRALWIPAGNRGQVFVFDAKPGTFRAAGEFTTRTVGERTAGPSSASVGDGVVYVGNRGDSSICAMDVASAKKGGCVTLASTPDGVAYVPTTKEIWITTPRDTSLTIVSSALKVVETVKVDGEPEGYAVDPKAGVFYTNLEDKDRTLTYDVKTRKVLATYSPECGGKGPRGLALDAEHHRLFVACADGARTLDLARGGAIAGRLQTGGGVDNIAYDAGAGQLLVASGQDGKLVIAQVDDRGGLEARETIPTAPGSRCVVAGDSGTAYVPDGRGGRLLVVSPAP